MLHGLGRSQNLRNRFNSSNERDALLSKTLKQDFSEDAGDHISSSPRNNFLQLEHLSRHTIAYITLKPSVKTEMSSIFIRNVVDANHAVTLLSTCVNGSRPVAHLSMASRHAFLAFKKNDLRGGFDMQIYHHQLQDEHTSHKIPYEAIDRIVLDFQIDPMIRRIYDQRRSDNLAEGIDSPEAMIVSKIYAPELLCADNQRISKQA